MEQAKEMAKLAVTALEEKKAEDVKVIDIRDVSTIADYFIIANGSNQNQLQAMRDAVDEELYKAGYTAKQIEGNSYSPRKIVCFMIWNVSGKTEKRSVWQICKDPILIWE